MEMSKVPWAEIFALAERVMDAQERPSIGERLHEYYTEDEAELWLMRPHPLLDGSTAVQMIARGREDRVHLAIDALEKVLEEGQVAT